MDEYQDTDALQDRILQKISKFAPVMVVGDDDQCIYQFRGTTHENIIEFPDVINISPGKHVEHLAQYWSES